MTAIPLNILLADDDTDDCIFFKEALEELPIITKFTTVNDGVQLMELLSKNEMLPHILYLDLNMPRKTGFDCLQEMKANEKLKNVPVIIFSTSFDKEAVNILYEGGAHYYIRKPAEFQNLKNIISKSLDLISQSGDKQPSKEMFVLTSI